MTIKIRHIISRWFLVATSFCLTLVITEFTLRTIYHNDAPFNDQFVPPGTFFQPDGQLIYKIAPNASNQVITDEFVQNTKTNNIGCRSNLLPDNKEQSQYRVFFVGDSSTFGYGISSNELTYPARFESYVQKENALKQIKVYNCGVPGYSPDQELRMIEKKIVEYKPDLVIWNIMNPSDLFDLMRQTNWPIPALYGIRNNQLTAYDARFNWLSFQNWVKTSTPGWFSRSYIIGQLIRTMSSTPFFGRKPNLSEPEMLRWASDKLKLEIEDAQMTANRHGFDLVVVLLPTKNLFTSQYRDEKFVTAMKNIASETGNKGIKIVDLNEEIQQLNDYKLAESGKKVLGISTSYPTPELFFKNDPHPNENGTEVFAKALASYFSRQEIIH